MMPHFIITCDGACPSNGLPGAGPMSGRWLLESTSTGAVKEGRGIWTGYSKNTNNQAEYLSLVAAFLDLLIRVEGKGLDPKRFDVVVRMDSSLVLGHVFHGHKCKAQHLKPLYRDCKYMVGRFKSVRPSKISGDAMKSIIGI